MDNQSLSHSRYNCTYHIVFIPKYRRKVMFGDLRREVGEVISKICRLEGVTIIKAATLPDHVHMYVSIPPKESVAKIVGVGDIMGGALIETSARRLKNEAENETKKQTALKLLKRGKQTVEEIAEDTGLSITEVEQLAGLQTV